jgi:hypothetical protein
MYIKTAHTASLTSPISSENVHIIPAYDFELGP